MLLCCVPVLDKTLNSAVSRCSSATTAKKCAKKRDARAKLLMNFRLTKTSLESICAASKFIALIPSGLMRQMLANVFGVKF